MIEHLSQAAGATLQPVMALALDALLGILAGALVLAGVSSLKRLKK
jgi:hypothetical protein